MLLRVKRVIVALFVFGCSEFRDRVPSDTGETGTDSADIKNPCAGVDCDDGDPCTSDRCVAATGECEHPPVPDGASCDDGAFCTANDSCSAGVCGGTATSCPTDGTPCTTGVCDEDGNTCKVVPLADAAPCDDGDTCTTGETCAAGACGGGSPVACEGAIGTCTPSVCVSGQGCVATPAPDSTSCDDGDACTEGDVCTGGTCTGVPKDCSGLDEKCRIAVCFEGQCSLTNAPAGPCDDGDACTVGDACAAGACQGAPLDCSLVDGPCAVGFCDPGGAGCIQNPVNEAQPCEDGDLCSITSACVSGFCALVTAVDCSSLDGPCAIGACVVATGECTTKPVLDGVACSDGDACTLGDQCLSGLCLGDAKDCGKSVIACWSVTCDPTDGKCNTGPDALLDGTPCADDLFCTVDGACAAGTCASAPRDCSGAAGTCQVAVCDEGNDACAPVPADDGSPCSDGQGCTTSDVCVAGSCVGLGTLSCSQLDGPCHIGECSEAVGGCTATPRPENADCSDGSTCTTGDACKNGECIGGAVDCSHLTSGCAVGVCTQDAGCVANPVPDGASCSDGVECTQGDDCIAGACTPGVPVGCPCPNPGRAIELTDGCVTTAGGPLLDSQRGFTVAFWMRTTTVASARLLDQRVSASAGDSDWSITYEAPGGVGQLRFQYGNTVGADSQLGMSGVALNDGLWHYVALVRDGDDLRWWVDGIGQPVATATNLLALTNPAPLAIGCGRFGGELFNGAIDEVAIWNYPRYRTSHAPPDRHPVTAGLVSLFRFDESPPAPADAITGLAANLSGGAASTESVSPSMFGCCGNGFVETGEACEPGSNPGCSGACELPAIPAQSADFDGSGCIVVDSQTLIPSVSLLTVEFWVQTTQKPAILLAKTSSDGNSGWRIELDDAGKPVFRGFDINGGPVVHLGSATVSNGLWHHVALMNFAGNKLRWFVDGVAAPTSTLDKLVPLGNTHPTRLGCGPTGATLLGRLDGVHVSRALRYSTNFTPSKSPAPDANTDLLFTFDLPAVNGTVVDLSPGLHDGAGNSGVTILPVAP